MDTEIHAKAQKKYDEKNTKQIILRLNKNTDADVIQKLESVESKQGYIRRLIREDIGG